MTQRSPLVSPTKTKNESLVNSESTVGICRPKGETITAVNINRPLPRRAS
jgi:hypothetical protein